MTARAIDLAAEELALEFLVLADVGRDHLPGIPHNPNPPIMIDAPSGTSAAAASALGRTLFTLQLY